MNVRLGYYNTEDERDKDIDLHFKLGWGLLDTSVVKVNLGSFEDPDYKYMIAYEKHDNS